MHIVEITFLLVLKYVGIRDRKNMVADELRRTGSGEALEVGFVVEK